MLATPLPVAMERPVARNYISFSAISTYQTCPLKYFFKYVAGIPERTISASLLFGKSIHSGIQFYFEQIMAGQPPPELDAIVDVYQAAWSDTQGKTIAYGSTETRDGLGKLADRLFFAFLESELAYPQGTILGVEEEFRANLIPGCPDVLAKVDLIIENTGDMVVTDYKTSRTSWNTDKIDQSAPQLLLYGEMVQEISPLKPVRLQFAVLPKIKSPSLTLHEVEFDLNRLKRTKVVVQKVWRAIEGKHFYPSPSPLNCPSCPFQGPCKAWRG